ncbi:MAG: hypothetical protein K2H13_08995 [Eubacterium sp.]|nr:hypothetical protein [Eubacterium sp.]
MSKKFNIYTVLDVRHLILEQGLECDDIFNDELNEYQKHLITQLNRNGSFTYILTKKGFEKYSEEYDVQIVGKIRKRQKHYTNYIDFDELKKQKAKKKIIGCCKLSIDSNSEEWKKYDIKRSDHSHTVGYAWIGGNQFLQVTTFNPLLLLIPLFLACMIAILFAACPKDDVILPWAIPSDITETADNDSQPQAELCYFAPFSEQITLTKDNKTVSLMNVKENNGNYYISYEVFVDGEKMQIRDIASGEDPGNAYITGLIVPGEKVDLDLWSKLNAGTYSLVCRATEYGFDTKDEKDIHYDLTTTLVVEK